MVKGRQTETGQNWTEWQAERVKPNSPEMTQKHWKERIWLADQSINGLYLCSQLYPRTITQEESRGVTKNIEVKMSPVGNQIGMSDAWVIQVLTEPSRRQSARGEMS